MALTRSFQARPVRIRSHQTRAPRSICCAPNSCGQTVSDGGRPLRVGLRGTDHRLMGLLCRRSNAATFNASLDIRTSDSLQPYFSGKAALQLKGQTIREARTPSLNFGSDYCPITAILLHFRVPGLHIIIKNGAPQSSGLGGSAALSVAL